MEEILTNFFETYNTGTIIFVLILILIFVEIIKNINYWRTINNISELRKNTETNNKLLVEIIKKMEEIEK